MLSESSYSGSKMLLSFSQAKTPRDPIHRCMCHRDRIKCKPPLVLSCAPNLTFVFFYLVSHGHCDLPLSHSSCLQNCDCFSTAEALKALRAPFVLVLMLKSEVPLDFANGLSLELWAQIMSLLVSGVPEENVMRCFSAERIFSQQANFTA